LSVPVRIALAVAALACAGWLALSYRSAHLEQQAIDLAITPKLTQRDTSLALHKLDDARAWQPDAGPKLAAWAVLLRANRSRKAEALLRQVVKAEPENTEAWGDVLRSTQGRFRSEAQSRLRTLQP
jgi:hypothetical protein